MGLLVQNADVSAGNYNIRWAEAHAQQFIFSVREHSKLPSKPREKKSNSAEDERLAEIIMRVRAGQI